MLTMIWEESWGNFELDCFSSKNSHQTLDNFEQGNCYRKILKEFFFFSFSTKIVNVVVIVPNMKISPTTTSIDDSLKGKCPVSNFVSRNTGTRVLQKKPTSFKLGLFIYRLK